MKHSMGVYQALQWGWWQSPHPWRWHSVLCAGDKVGIDRGLDLMTLDVFSCFNDSVIQGFSSHAQALRGAQGAQQDRVPPLARTAPLPVPGTSAPMEAAVSPAGTHLVTHIPVGLWHTLVL